MKKSSELLPSGHLYCASRGRAIVKLLGEGIDGGVWKTDAHTAVKISEDSTNHARELQCYLRLRERQVLSVTGFNVPQLIGHDDSLLAIEMTIVKPPFLLDFGKAYLDAPAPYYADPDIMEQWNDKNAEEWEGRWPIVKKAFYALQRYGIYHYDLNTKNVQFVI